MPKKRSEPDTKVLKTTKTKTETKTETKQEEENHINKKHITITQETSVFTSNNYIFQEIINWEVLIKMLYSDEILKITENKDENERKQMEDILKKGMIVNKHKNRPIDKELLNVYYHNIEKYLKPFISIKYFYSQNNLLGRVYPEKSLSLGSIRKGIRHHLSSDIYIDLDIVNCHSSLLNEIFEKKYPTLNDYVTNREKYFEKICNHFSVKDEYKCFDYKTPDGYNLCKELFTRILYFGSYDAWVRSNGLPNIEAPDFICELKSELLEISEIIKNENPLLVEIVNKSDTNNIEGSIVSWFLQEHERQVLEKLFDFFKKKKLITKNNVVLCFDGLMLLKNKVFENNAILKEAELFIYKNLGFDIKLQIKPFDKLPYTEALNKIDVIEEKENSYNIPDFNTIANEFELTHAKITNKSLFVKQTNEGVIFLNKTNLISSYENKIYEKMVFNGTYDELKEFNFIRDWLVNNPSQRCYEDMGIFPDGLKCPDNIFNLWRKFDMEFITDYEEKPEELKIILNLIKVLCGNEEIVYDYFIKWIGQMIQYPAIKTICPTLISKEGAGKGTFMILMKKMLGESKVFETQNPSRDVWGEFNTRMASAFLVNLDELSKKDTLDSEGKIKGLITEPKLTINSKGINQYEINSYHRFITTTNNEEPFTSKSDDRRKMIMRCSDELIGNKEYFKKMYEYLDDINVIKTCFEYFKNIEGLKDFNKLIMPATEYQVDIQEVSKSPIEKWIYDFIQTNYYVEDPIELYGKEAFNLFSEWKKKCQIEYNVNLQAFGLRLKRLNIKGITKGRHTNKGETNFYDIKILKEHYKIGEIEKDDNDNDDDNDDEYDYKPKCLIKI